MYPFIGKTGKYTGKKTLQSIILSSNSKKALDTQIGLLYDYNKKEKEKQCNTECDKADNIFQDFFFYQKYINLVRKDTFSILFKLYLFHGPIFLYNIYLKKNMTNL